MIDIMSLIKCKGCGNNISSKADNCPTCGNPIKKKTNIGCVGVIFIAFIISIVLSSMSSMSDFFSKRAAVKKQAELVQKRAELAQNQKDEFFKKIDDHYNNMVLYHDDKIQQASKELALFEKYGQLDYKDVSEYSTKIQIKNLEIKAKDIPASNAAENLKIYKQLSSLDPENLNYNLKIDIYYEKLAQQRIAENEREDMLSARRHYDAYDALSPRMKEQVRINVLKDFGKHPENYYVIDGTLYKK